jgi:drug/metabolite transporter (DMT)-like permease
VGIALALATAVLFGASFVLTRLALERAPHPLEGGAVMDGVAFLVATAAAGLSGFQSEHIRGSVLVPLIAAGALAPGISQPLLVRAIASSGAARTAQIVGTAPLLAAALAIVFLDEPLSLTFLLGTLVIVSGVVVQTRDSSRRTGSHALGIALAAAAALAFAGRDNLIRSGLRGDEHTPALVSAAIILAAGTATAILIATAAHGERTFGLLAHSFVPFSASGVVAGLAYICLAASLDRLRVTVVSPLVATQTLWALLSSTLLLRRSEVLGRPTALAAALIVCGAVVVGISRG